MQQGMYKNDVSSEMVARMYICQTENDIHNQEIYPPEVFDFATIFNNLIDGVIKGITNEDGWHITNSVNNCTALLSF